MYIWFSFHDYRQLGKHAFGTANMYQSHCLKHDQINDDGEQLSAKNEAKESIWNAVRNMSVVRVKNQYVRCVNFSVFEWNEWHFTIIRTTRYFGLQAFKSALPKRMSLESDKWTLVHLFHAGLYRLQWFLLTGPPGLISPHCTWEDKLLLNKISI